MPGILDDIMSYLPQGILSGNTPDYATLNPDAGDTDALAKALAGSPYDALDKKQKEAAAKKAALTIFDTGGPADPNIGISGQQAMTAGPFGALAPMVPSPPPTAPAPPPPVAAPAAPSAAPTPSIPLPRPRPVVAPAAPSTVDDTTLPATVANANAQAPAGPTPAVPESSLLGRIGQGIKDFGDATGAHTATLLALAGGLAGAPSWGTGIGRGLTAAAAALPVDQKLNLQQGSARGTYEALIAAGAPKQQALVAAYNPESTLSKALIQSYISDRKGEIKSIKSKDMFGNETERLVSVNPYTNESKEIITSAPSGAGIAPGGTNAVFAPGVTMQNFNHSAVGDDYLKQFDPEIQAAAKNYLAGQSIPTGRQAQSQAIKMVAQKYGSDIGMPADDAAITQRKQWANSLGNTQNGVGLQAKGFQQGLEHFSKLSDNLVKMNLSNGMGIEPIAGLVNGAKNLTTDQQELVHKNDVIGQALAREMGNLFAKNGGGVHEADETKKNVSNATMSSKAAAGSLEAIDELMQGGLKTLEQRRDELFPNGNAPKGSQFLGPEQQKALEHIRNNIAILRGEKVAAAPGRVAAPQSSGLPAGWSVQVH